MKLNVPFGSSQPDPYIVGIGGKYYMYATHVDGVQLYVSSDKLNWDFAGFCFTREEYKEFCRKSIKRNNISYANLKEFVYSKKKEEWYVCLNE